MSVLLNPALEKFVAALGEARTFGEVHIRRGAQGFDLCHAADREVDSGKLRRLGLDDLRGLAQVTAEGAFRPLKSAPTLQQGWRLSARDDAELERALQHLYPGGVADWFAAQADPPPVTSYREYTGRQTGMYRITTLLNDAQAARMIRSGCHAQFCLKRRLWTVEGLAPDAIEGKSLIPCLEPCPVLLEFARKAMRIEQEEVLPGGLAPSDVETLREAVELALSKPSTVEREADFGAASNPRRQRLVLEKLADLTHAAATKPAEGGK